MRAFDSRVAPAATFFPIGGDRWQTLEPTQPGAIDTSGMADTAAATDSGGA